MTPLEGRVAALERQVALLAEMLNTCVADLDAKLRKRVEHEATKR